ncbi:hypothetical protein HG535_0B03930 [Zygotorulaspora mrakii]|uniref:Thiaminase-2/PQQC domain-containing protein n=1 Tax=Zygotorulaspora mrakii TaxID=42260 RepID=A0A7H9AYS6_ZYGMR|nr:uncharacterized protein HG535_0B03930 [Zygotorulaspora mrakii]QLG71353.1 hypothetical protein HG535_0B03930 [Zygotorulaspora mrakii]
MQSTTDVLLAKNEALFKKATEHNLTKELCQGTLKDRTLYIYLAQDVQFFETGLRLLCKLTSLAPSTFSLITLAKKIGFFASDENTYFENALKLLGGSVAEEQREAFKAQKIGDIKSYVDFLEEMTNSTKYTYAELVTYLWVAEQVYWTWARDSPRKENLHWKYQTWIDLHDGEHFQVWCEFLRDEVNKYSVAEVEEMFKKVLQMEYEFFETSYSA